MRFRFEVGCLNFDITIVNDVCNRHGITAAGKTDCPFVHNDIAQFTAALSVPLKISGRAANLTGIESDTLRPLAFFDSDKPNLNTLLGSVRIPVQFIIF